jgi:hypothetical protein
VDERKRRGASRAGSVLLSARLSAEYAGGGPGWKSTNFLRADANFDGKVDIADPIFSVGYLFLGGEGRAIGLFWKASFLVANWPVR